MFSVEMHTSGAAFEEGGAAEVARILRKLADRVEEQPMMLGEKRLTSVGYVLHDGNGNTVGGASWKVG